MNRAGRIAFLAALATLGALAIAGPASGQDSPRNPAAQDPYWLGPYFAGLELTEERFESGAEFVYGECQLIGESTCSRPARIETATTCAANPIADESPFSPVALFRGGGLMTRDLEVGRVSVSTGNRTFTIDTAEIELVSAALREARRRSQPSPEALAPPVYPITVLSELKRVTAAAERLHDARAIAKATELTPDLVRYRLRVAELLGPEALADVPLPKLSTARVRRLIQIAVNFRSRPERTAEKRGKTVAQLRKMLRPVRGLTGFC